MKRIIILLTMLLLTNQAFAKFSFLSDEPQLMPVEKAYVFSYIQQQNNLIINFSIADGYYMYRDKLKFEFNNSKVIINLPKAEAHKDNYFGEQFVYRKFVEFKLPIISASDNANFTLTFMGCAEGKLCFPPTTVKGNIDKVDISNVGKSLESDNMNETNLTSSDFNSEGVASNLADPGKSKLIILILFFIAGIGLSLTPCIFPMYPILSGIIVGQGALSLRKAFALSMAYVQGMAITYSLLGLVVAWGGMKYQAYLQQPAILIALAILLFLLSLSMFGLYEIKLPAKLQDKLNGVANKQQGGKFLGVFIMGVISGLIASPCTTAPLAGTLAYIAKTGDLLLGFFALYFLGLGMGVPLLIIGTSGGKLLPKAGQWMDLVKNIFGFLLIAVSVVMLTRIWPFAATYLFSIWGLCFAGYLWHVNQKGQLSWGKSIRSVFILIGIILSVLFGVQDFLHSGVSQNINVQSGVSNVKVANEGFKHIKTVDNLKDEVSKASKLNKLVMVDFYADWCVSCIEYGKITFQDPKVKKLFENFVLLKADVTKTDELDNQLLQEYSIKGLPAILFFDSKGNFMKNYKVSGFMNAEKFEKLLNSVLKDAK